MNTDATKPADVREALQDALSACSSVHTGADRRRVMRDGCPMYLQTEEWCRWLEDEVAPKLRAALLDMQMMVNGLTEAETAATASCAGLPREGSSPEGRASEGPSAEGIEPGSEGTRPEKSSEREAPSVQVVEPTQAMLDAFQKGFQQQLQIRHKARFKPEAQMTARERMSAEEAGLRAMLKAQASALPAAQQPAVEPVAWLVHGGRMFADDSYLLEKHARKAVERRKDGSQATPLYASPTAQPGEKP